MKLLKDIPMTLEQSDQHPEIYNMVADGKLDIDFIMNTLNSPPADCKIITIFSEDRDLTNVVKFYGESLLDKLTIDWALSSIEVEGKTLFILERGEK